MKKVCHLTTAHKRYDDRIWKKECASLANNNYIVYLIVNDKLPSERKERVNIISTYYKPQNRLSRMLIGTMKVCKKALKVNADLYHIHDPELLPAALILKIKGKIVIFDSHEFYAVHIREKNYINKYIRNLLTFAYDKFENYVVKKIDAVVIPCTLAGKNIFKNRAKKTVILNNLPIIEESEVLKAEKEKRTICYAGSLDYERGIFHLIKAAYKANVKLYLAGTFSSEEFCEKLKKMKEYNCVQYLGNLDRAEVMKLYSKVEIGMCTLLDKGQYSKIDNLPTKAYEYMMMGLPVIISNHPYAQSFIKCYEFGVAVNPKNIKEISNAINFLIENNEIAKRMGECGKECIKEKYNWKKEEEKLLKLYKELLH